MERELSKYSATPITYSSEYRHYFSWVCWEFNILCTTPYGCTCFFKCFRNKYYIFLSSNGQYASDQNVETKNKFVTELTYNYEFTDRFAFDYLLGYKADQFSGFDYQWYTEPGAKYKLIVSENQNLTVDGNLLYSEDRYEATPLITPPVDSYSNNYLGYRLKAVYAWQIIHNLKFDQELSIRGSLKETKNYFAFSKSALSSKISDIKLTMPMFQLLERKVQIQHLQLILLSTTSTFGLSPIVV